METDEDQLRAEQRHLDETYEAYDTALKLLRSRSRTSGIDDFANEASSGCERSGSASTPLRAGPSTSGASTTTTAPRSTSGATP
jgi:hypothetical protein